MPLWVIPKLSIISLSVEDVVAVFIIVSLFGYDSNIRERMKNL